MGPIVTSANPTILLMSYTSSLHKLFTDDELRRISEVNIPVGLPSDYGGGFRVTKDVINRNEASYYKDDDIAKEPPRNDQPSYYKDDDIAKEPPRNDQSSDLTLESMLLNDLYNHEDVDEYSSDFDHEREWMSERRSATRIGSNFQPPGLRINPNTIEDPVQKPDGIVECNDEATREIYQ